MPLVLLLMVTLLLCGCATTEPYTAEPSYAIPPESSPLGRQVMAAAAAHPAGRSGFRLLAESQAAFDARARLIRSAERTLDLQYYIFEDGLTTRLLVHELFQAADRGVRVRLLLDDTVSDGRGDYFAVLAQHPNIAVRLFNPVRHGRFSWATRMLARLWNFSLQHRRMHNKLLLADSSLVITGGRNLGDEYYAEDRESNFADMDLLAAGPVATALATSFDQYWNHPLAVPVEHLHDEAPTADALTRQRQGLEDALAKTRGEQPARVAALTAYRQAPPFSDVLGGLIWAPGKALWDDPDKMLAKGRPPLSMLLAKDLIEPMQQVEQELMMVSAYFVPTSIGVAYLGQRVKAGARVRILTNSLEATDVPAVHGGYAPYREQLLALGVELHELRPEPGQALGEYSFRGDSESRLHSKAMVLDGRQAFVGAPNFDPRSVFWNTEVGVLVDSPALAGQVRALIKEGMQPRVSYRLERQPRGGLIWITEVDGERQVLTREPGSVWQRLNAWGARVLGLEPML